MNYKAYIYYEDNHISTYYVTLNIGDLLLIKSEPYEVISMTQESEYTHRADVIKSNYYAQIHDFE